MIDSRAEVLAAVRRNRPPAAPLPELDRDWTSYADRRAQFISVLESVGGQALVVPDIARCHDHLRQLPQFSQAHKIASFADGIPSQNFDSSQIDSPHALEDIDLAVLPGEFAVAENGAVWIVDRHIPHRVAFFLCQHLVLVVPASEIVDHMHAAYQRLALGAAHVYSPQAAHFGAFVSGPSKTADIEQSLVIGAHGPRSLVVCLVGV